MTERQTFYTYGQKQLNISTPDTTLTIINGYPDMSESDEEPTENTIVPLNRTIPFGTTQTFQSSEQNSGYNPVTITATSPDLQNKSITIETNTTQTISADNNYDGMNSLTITTNVPQREQINGIAMDGCEFNSYTFDNMSINYPYNNSVSLAVNNVLVSTNPKNTPNRYYGMFQVYRNYSSGNSNVSGTEKYMILPDYWVGYNNDNKTAENFYLTTTNGGLIPLAFGQRNGLDYYRCLCDNDLLNYLNIQTTGEYPGFPLHLPKLIIESSNRATYTIANMNKITPGQQIQLSKYAAFLIKNKKTGHVHLLITQTGETLTTFNTGTSDEYFLYYFDLSITNPNIALIGTNTLYISDDETDEDRRFPLVKISTKDNYTSTIDIYKIFIPNTLLKYIDLDFTIPTSN